ncbi:MAG TPA: isocitrate lyase/phosphoenolpyruvate mutase family protein [Bacteroidia bacterium]|nr:isocitrate lyase/phosphoenolpyruvate mutase family protein [Bacteroidia bacterium]
MVSTQQKEKAERFLKYHHDKELLVLVNAWDPGSARLIEACGYKAVATTSMGVAAALGYPDCENIQLPELLRVVTAVVDAVNVPVTVDFEAGFGRTTEEVVASVTQLIATGAVGINIEDSMNMGPVLMDADVFCERIAAIRALSNALGLHLVINTRTDSFFTSKASHSEKLAESIRRGNLYRAAGADCIFVQPVTDKETISTLVKEIDAPVNILCNPSNGGGLPPTTAELTEMGVARLSLGSSVMKATLALVRKIAAEIKADGTYSLLSESVLPIGETTLAYKMATGQAG